MLVTFPRPQCGTRCNVVYACDLVIWRMWGMRYVTPKILSLVVAKWITIALIMIIYTDITAAAPLDDDISNDYVVILFVK